MTMTDISVQELRAAMAGAEPPVVVDVRKRAAFREATSTVAGALRREPDDVAAWAASLPTACAVAVYCVHGHEVSQGTARALGELGVRARYLEGGIEAWSAAGGGLDRKPRGAATRWVTRERPKIDRIACPWLIARFVDPDAEFLYVPAPQVLAEAARCEAVPYDVADVHFTHEGERCSFDAFLRHYRLRDPALQKLAVIVRGADTGKPELAPQAPGLLAISQGLSRNFANDHEMLAHGMVMYDALYTWCKQDPH
jgi:rhodanese-related sulfurtransferase